MQRTFVSDLKIMNVFVVRLRRWRFLRGLQMICMWVNVLYKFKNKWILFFKFAPEATIGKALELNFISSFRSNIFVFDMRCKLFLGQVDTHLIGLIIGEVCVRAYESHALRLKLRRNRVVKHDINGQGQKIDRLPIFILKPFLRWDENRCASYDGYLGLIKE